MLGNLNAPAPQAAEALANKALDKIKVSASANARQARELME